MTALVLDAHLKSSLAAIRSLGRQGVPIIAGSHRDTAMGLYSRYVRKSFVYPSPLLDRWGFLDVVIRYSGQPGKTVVMAFSDSTLLPLAQTENYVARHGAGVLPSDRDDFYMAFDKAMTLKLAERIGVEIPVTYFCTNEADVAAVLPELDFPVVVKPRRSVSWNGNEGVQTSVAFALSPDDLKRKWADMFSRTKEPPLIQEYLPGEEGSVQFMCDRGRILAACANRRIRSVSPSGGLGVLKETIPLSYQGLGERAEFLVSQLHWSGPIMVEFKTGRETGVPKLMEINGRFWGSLPLALAAGVDFPGLYYRLACGEQIASRVSYQSGMFSRHFVGDVMNILAVLFRHDPMRPLAYPGRWRAMKDFFVVPRPCRSDVFDFQDIKPSVVEFFDTMSVISGSARNRFSAHLRGMWHTVPAKGASN